MSINDARSLNESDMLRIETDFLDGLYNDKDLSRLFTTIRIQRAVLRELFNQFHAEPMRLVSVAEPVRNSTLNHWKELVAMESRS